MIGPLTSLGMGGTRARLIGIAAVVVVAAGLTAWVMQLRTRATAYGVLQRQHIALARKYGCADRAPAERDLASCLMARDLDAARAQRAAIERQRTEAARAQAELDRLTAVAEAQARATDAFIDGAAIEVDGPVPKILRDTWARERKARGLE